MESSLPRTLFSSSKNSSQADQALSVSKDNHASGWVLLPENMGVHVGIDESSFCHEVYTILHNKIT